MKINRLNISGFGKFTDKELLLGTGLNLIYGENEAGKSTIQSFIKAMLFDFPRKNIDGEGRLPDQKKYKPWSSSDFGGILEIETDDGHILKIDRDFARKKASVFDGNLRDTTSSFTYSKKNGLSIGENLLNMDRECFENTAFIKQGGTIVLQNDRKNLFEKLMNLSQTGNETTSLASALSALSAATTALGNNRTKNRPYNSALSKFSVLTAEYDSVVKKRMEMSEYGVKQKLLEKDIKKLKILLEKYEHDVKVIEYIKEKKQLSNIKAKYENYSSEIKKIIEDIDLANLAIQENLCPPEITESKILEHIKITAKSLEKQKIIDDIDPEESLAKLERSQKNKRIWLALCYIGLTASVLLALLFYPGIFMLATAFTAALIYLHHKKPIYSAENLHAQLKLIRECREDLVMVNAFIDSAGEKIVSDFENAEITLNRLFDNKKQSVLMENRLAHLKERKSDIERFRKGVLGQYDSIFEIENNIKTLDLKINEGNSEKGSVTQIPIKNPRSELEVKQHQLSGINAILHEYMQSDEEIANLEESLETYREKLVSIQAELDALKIASETILQSAEEMQKEIIPRLNEKTEEILKEITNGSHSSFATGLDSEINIEYQNAVHSLWEFSDGTVDQMYFSLRVAASEVFSEKETVPIIIDEAFAYYDENRIKNAFAFLSDLAKRKQIIVFTCKEKEVSIISDLPNINIIRL